MYRMLAAVMFALYTALRMLCIREGDGDALYWS